MTDAELAAEQLAALLDAERENTALRAEVSRLREMLLNAGWPREAEELAAEALRYERAAVVAYLRACEDESCVFADDIASLFAAEIERGEHRREEKP